MKVTFGYVTDRGLNPRRTRNEDNLLVMPEQGLFLVADGVGGRRGGETASRLVIDIFRRVFRQPQFIDDLRAALLSTLDLCNQKIYEESHAYVELEGMATTIASVAVDGDQAIVAHVGDSRVYRADGQGLIQLTEDHSEVNEALRAGRITEELAATHPKRNVINRALGADSEVEPDLIGIELDELTTLLLCTDGVTRHLSDERLLDILRSGHHPQTVCQMIRQGCYEAGAEDNLTAIVIDFGPRSYAEEVASARSETTVELVRPDGGRVIELNLRDDGPEDPDELLAADRRFEGESIEPGEVIEMAFEPADEAGENLSADEADDLNGNDDGSPEEDSEGDSPEEPEEPEEPEHDEEPEEPEDDAGPPEKPESGGWMAGVRSFLAGMRWSLLLIGVVAGVLIGAILGPPLTERFNDLFGVQTIYDQLRIEQPPRDPEVNASYARYLEGRKEEARQRLEQLAAANANNAEAIYYLGVIDYAQGRYPEAIVRFRQAVQLDPTLPNVRVRLAMAYLSTGQLRTGRDTLQEILTPQGLKGEPGGTGGDPMASPTPAGSPAETEAKPVG